jgi:hypothetical protein
MGKHYVPQEFLRAFASDSARKMVWVFDKQTRQWSNAAIAKVAQSPNYFSPEVEDRLTNLVENPGNVALSALRRGEFPSAEQGGDLLSYIAVMLTRVPRKRLHATGIVPGVIDSVIARTKAEILAERTTDTEARVVELLAEVDRIEARYRKEAVSILREEIEDPWPTEKVLRGIHAMCWRIVEVPAESELLSSDNPAFFFSGYGIGSPESEVSFPLSPTLALMGSRQGPPGEALKVKAKRPLAKEINRRMIVGATRLVFAAKPHSWVKTVSTRSQTDLNRIQW